LLPLTKFADVLVICEDDGSVGRYLLPWPIRRGGTYVLWASQSAVRRQCGQENESSYRILRQCPTLARRRMEV
jgi:hypothetical protein